VEAGRPARRGERSARCRRRQLRTSADPGRYGAARHYPPGAHLARTHAVRICSNRPLQQTLGRHHGHCHGPKFVDRMTRAKKCIAGDMQGDAAPAAVNVAAVPVRWTWAPAASAAPAHTPHAAAPTRALCFAEAQKRTLFFGQNHLPRPRARALTDGASRQVAPAPAPFSAELSPGPDRHAGGPADFGARSTGRRRDGLVLVYRCARGAAERGRV